MACCSGVHAACSFHGHVSEQRFIQDPYATTFGGFSKVTNFFKAALRPPESGGSRCARSLELPPQTEDEPGFELITCVRHGNKQTERFRLCRPEEDLCTVVICEGGGAWSQT